MSTLAPADLAALAEQLDRIEARQHAQADDLAELRRFVDELRPLIAQFGQVGEAVARGGLGGILGMLGRAG